MRKIAASLFAFMLLFCPAFAQAADWGNFAYSAEKIGGAQGTLKGGAAGNGFSQAGWTYDYKKLAAAAAVAVLALAALAYLASGLLESENLKSWAKGELGQAVATAIIAGLLVLGLTLMDYAMEASANSIVSPCGTSWDWENARPLGGGAGSNILPAGSPRALQYSVCYLDSLYGAASALAQTEITNSLKFSRQAYKSEGMQGTNWWSAYYGYYSRPNAEMRLQSEMSGLQFDMISKIMISLQAQRYLVAQIAGVIGPTLLLIGILLRALPFTRKAGGMFIALAIGLLIILPCAYLLAWATLVVGVYGTDVLGAGEIDAAAAACEPCSRQPPVAYEKATLKPLGFSEFTKLRLRGANGELLEHTDAQGLAAAGLESCYPKKKAGDTANGAIDPETSGKCPLECRELPFPSYKQICDEQACGKIPKECKIIRWLDISKTPTDDAPYCSNYDEGTGLGCDAECKDECKNVLPQIRGDAENPQVLDNKCEDCATCPVRCRVYNTDDGSLASTDPLCTAAGNDKRCEACTKRLATGDKSCHYGISGLASGSGCDHVSVCGSRVSLKQALSGAGYANTCPVECRIHFDASQEGYKDPIYKQYCEGTFAAACSRCPTACKIPADSTGAGASAQLEAVYRPSATGCAMPPTFENGNVAIDKCMNCPVSCRFKEVSPLDVGLDPFMSHAPWSLNCEYEHGEFASGGSKITEAQCRDLQIADGYDTAKAYADYYRITLPGKSTPSCSPSGKVYRLTSRDPASLCPLYYGTTAANMGETVLVAPNGRSSPECNSPEARLACSDANCGAECKSQWPPICTLVPDVSQYAEILENGFGACNGCHTLNAPSNTTGPQCQVSLQYQSPAIYKEHPTLCKDSCYDAACIKQCYPTLELPTGSLCGEYQKDGDAAKDAAKWGNCAACPYECRYDYAGSKPNTIDKNYAAHCGIGLLSDLAARRYVPDPSDPLMTIPDPNQKYWICEDTYKYCQSNSLGRIVARSGTNAPADCISNGYACNSVGQTPSVWRISIMQGGNSVPGHPCYGEFPADSSHPKDWWQAQCALGPGQSLSWSKNTPKNPLTMYSCDYVEKYPGLNKKLVAEIGVTVCGDIRDLNNPDYNWCGQTPQINGNAAQGCDMRVEANGGCSAEYDARKAACFVADGSSATACRSCPPVCRITVPETSPAKVAYCKPELSGAVGLPKDGYDPKCSLADCGNTCRIGAGTSKPPSDMKIGPDCKVPSSGSGKFCPVRCRVTAMTLDEADWGEYCASEGMKKYGIDCSDLPNSCKKELPESPCEACAKCETDCLAKPYVRQNCDEACPDNDMGSKDFNPASMLNNWEGPNAWGVHKAIGSLGVAAVAMPIFALIITLAFVRVLSPLIGGDIEIPGLMRFL